MHARPGQVRGRPTEGVLGAGLRLSPFRAVRPEVDGSALAARLAPPGDLVGPDELDALLARDPYNVVRLILARRARSGVHAGAQPELHGRALLARWRADGQLRTDPTASLYLVQLPPSTGRAPVRGLLGVLALDDASDLTLLPHEDVIDDAVAERAAELVSTGADLEPLLALRSAGDVVADVLADPDRYGRPVAGTGPAGHRLWAVDDPDLCRALSQAVARHPVLVADGHHRLAAHELLRRDPASGVPSSVLTLLVEQGEHGLSLAPIHRVLPGVPVDRVLALATPPAVRDDDPAGRPPTSGVRVVSAGGSWRVHDDGRLAVEAAEGLLAAAGDVSGVRYERDPVAAVDLARRTGGTALLLAPPTLEQLVAAVRAGRRLPRKSTSFEPKPPTGLALRCYDLADDAIC